MRRHDQAGRVRETAEAARILGVLQNTLRVWAEAGKIPVQRNLFLRRDLERFWPRLPESQTVTVNADGEIEGKMPDQPFPIGRRIDLPGHFDEPVVLESVRALGDGFECRVRLSDGTPDESILSRDEAANIFGQQAEAPTSIKPADAESLRLLVESSRIRLAYTHSRHFAVSLPGIRTLPHQIEAVYLRMLPQPRLRCLLADDPGAGKTIMAGLLIKEMRLRKAIDRGLILCPALLTIQWQDELLGWFANHSTSSSRPSISSSLSSPGTARRRSSRRWTRPSKTTFGSASGASAGISSSLTRHTSAAPTPRAGRGDETEKTKRYRIAEKLAANSDHLLLLTATPHHGDDVPCSKLGAACRTDATLGREAQPARRRIVPVVSRNSHVPHGKGNRSGQAVQVQLPAGETRAFTGLPQFSRKRSKYED